VSQLPTLSYKGFAGSKAGLVRLRFQEEVSKSTMSKVESIQSEPEFAAFIGIDWADQKHIWCLQTAGSKQRESGELEHTPEAVESWVANLYQRFAPRPIAVAVEQSRGALVFMLSKYELFHLFPVPAQMAASMRQALYPSGAKDDPRDAACCWTCCCSIATNYAVCRRTVKQPVECRIWWRNGASWWMKRQHRSID
jgi:Transposase